MWVEAFGYGLAALALATSVGMLALGRRWQRIEAAAYGGIRRPAWFWLAATILIMLWLLAAWDFAASAKTWAGWALVVGVSLIWSVKAAALVFNPKGRKAVSGIDTDAGWRKIGLALLPVAAILAVLTALA